MSKKKISCVPNILNERFEMLQELETDRMILKNFKKGAKQAEIDFVNARISELERALSESEIEVTELVNKIKEVDFIAFTATYQRFMYGWTWAEIAFSHGLSENNIKKRFYKTMKSLLHQSEEGT